MINTGDTDTLHVFIDETGTTDLNGNVSGSNLYICTAVLIAGNKLTETEIAVEDIANRLGNGAPFKSSRIGTRHELRLKYLSEIAKLDFRYVFLITNKNLIDKESGLQYKKSRYKFIHRKLHEQLVKITGNLKIVIDEHGKKEFQDECISYFKRNEVDLFHCSDPQIAYGDDEQVRLLQLADFIGGTLLYCFDTERECEHSPAFRKILRDKEAGYDFFPKGKFEVSLERPVPDTEVAEQLRRNLYNKAVSFLDQYENSGDTKDFMQYYTLNSLFLASKFEEAERRYIFSDQIINKLKEQDYSISKRNFTVDVIGGLRRAGIIIAGSPNGYKLALSLDDINEYLEHDRNIILPMLDKLKMAKGTVKALIDHDILAHPPYDTLGTLINSLANVTLHQYSSEPDIEKIKIIEDDKQNEQA